MTNEQFQNLLRFFKALADESRLKILGILANQEYSVEELAVLLQLKEPTISHHLAKLKELKLVSMRPDGNAHLYQLDIRELQSISQEIFTQERIASLVKDVNTEAWENKVLHTYIEGDIQATEVIQRLKEIPTSRKKRLVVLKWIANKFDLGVSYQENTVDEILQRYYHDSSTLKRELVNSPFMEKESGAYRRLPVLDFPMDADRVQTTGEG
ncbi:metalloregulator ArsR/SmtB family transcription factor [Calothrix sp. 336/3]|uniref:metalloregulator ArsR/SmtB family transcription factor n=1 Tax=Calothrix sp. 336/3 TaxID=1337936 RepID=UPI000624D7A1|nr:metalloregulator ArsR/SmtB family transcription factor [Calothrix sp. 336/3]AKG21967.1 ArsR family transcriptional regulator [Calothrix sp. 336/3]